MLDDDQDMADMYLGRRQEAEMQPSQSARQEIEPPSPSNSAQSLDDLEPSDFMGQMDSESEAEGVSPARPRRQSSHVDVHAIRQSTAKQAQPPPQVATESEFNS